MYVKSLRLAGFKSFADPTVLEFEPGVNVIVGPNGSGKSNIADALQWVLGSQAPSTLRGASMEDVIFAGSAGRGRLGMAEVQLTLDNTSRILPLDLNEVNISRSTDRAGASEYRLNGAPCRLLDIAELLSDTGIGRSIHTIVSQGNLDAVLQAKPEDRRSFIEEAAQVGKFRRRKDRSLKKIERVDDNLMRLNDVLTELRRSIKPLKRQATASQAYTELMAEQRVLKQRLVAHEISTLSRVQDGSDPEAERRRADLLADELASVRARLEGAAAERLALVAAAENQRGTAHRIQRAADRLSGLAKLAHERGATISARLEAETEEGYRERIRLLDADKHRWSAERETLVVSASALRARADAATAEAEAARARLEMVETSLSQKRVEETIAAQAFVRAEGGEAAGRATLGSLEARVHAVNERRESKGRSLQDDLAALSKAETEIKTIELELDRITEDAAQAEIDLEGARERAEQLRDRLGVSHAGRSAAQARLEALREVADLLADLPEALARLAGLAQDAEDRSRLATTDEEEAGVIAHRADEEVERKWERVATLDEELRRLDALMSGAAERFAGVRRQREAHEIELAALDEELARTQEALADAERVAAEERSLLPERIAARDEARRQREAAELVVSEAREAFTLLTAESRAADLEARAAGERAASAEQRFAEASAGVVEAESALAGLADLRHSLEASRDRARMVAETALRCAGHADTWATEAEDRAVAARDAAEAGEQQVIGLRTRERELADRLDEISARRNAAEVRRAEARARMDALVERAMEEWGLTPAALESVEPLHEPEIVAARARTEDLERHMRRMGVINPRAAEEYAELAERETFLTEQMEDLRSSKRDLMKVVREVDETIVQVFGQAFEDVAHEFEGVFERLFPGGSGKLKLTEPDDLLKTGIEIEARPPGKNVRKLSLLSGGERSLVALAFLFSIFRSRPSPFYLLDEVEAALDDFNLQRFIVLVKELEARAQVLVVTHQKRTMESADVLYGVSMNRDGVSQVVAKRMEEVSF